MFCFVFFFSKLLSDAVRIIFDRYKIHKNCKRRNRNQDVLLLSFHGQYLFVWVKEILHETHACIHVNTHDFMKEITEWLCLNLRPSITLAWVMMIFFLCVFLQKDDLHICWADSRETGCGIFPFQNASHQSVWSPCVETLYLLTVVCATLGGLQSHLVSSNYLSPCLPVSLTLLNSVLVYMCLTSLWCATLKRIILILILHGSSGSSRLNLPDILQRWDRLGWVHHGTHCLHSQTCYEQPLTIGRSSSSQTVGWNSQQRTGLECSPWVITLGPVNFLLDQQQLMTGSV